MKESVGGYFFFCRSSKPCLVNDNIPFADAQTDRQTVEAGIYFESRN